MTMQFGFVLGLDNVAVALALGPLGLSARRTALLAVLFGAAEALMPLAGTFAAAGAFVPVGDAGEAVRITVLATLATMVLGLTLVRRDPAVAVGHRRNAACARAAARARQFRRRRDRCRVWLCARDLRAGERLARLRGVPRIRRCRSACGAPCAAARLHCHAGCARGCGTRLIHALSRTGCLARQAKDGVAHHHAGGAGFRLSDQRRVRGRPHALCGGERVAVRRRPVRRPHCPCRTGRPAHGRARRSAPAGERPDLACRRFLYRGRRLSRPDQPLGPGRCTADHSGWIAGSRELPHQHGRGRTRTAGSTSARAP